MKLSLVLFGIVQVLRLQAMRYPAFRKRLKEKNMVVQLKLADDSVGRYIEFRDGRIRSKGIIHPNPDVVVFFKNEAVALKVLSPKKDYLFNIDAMKNFKMGIIGPDELTAWLTETVSMAESAGWKFGESMGGGVTRYTTDTNGGPMHVYVANGKILRLTPIEFTEKDAPSWSIEARGRTFTPPRQTSAAPYAIGSKSLIYSKDRLLYPMKRVDFDPNGARNPQNRGVSGYQRISWNEALDIVTSEFKRVRRDFGPGAIALSHGSHHTWGNVGYYLSSLYRFFNLVGFTKVMHNPDSWEGWYWGALHHWGHSMRLGIGEVFGQVEDCLKECEMVVFWGSDPEATNGVYAAYDGTLRRLWAKELGIKFVHIDPHWNHTAALLGGKWIAPRPGTDPALAQAICHVWITEGLYDKSFVQNRTTGFDEWAEYIMGRKDGTPKTPEWAGKRDRSPGTRHPGARARVGAQQDVSRRWRIRQRIRRPVPDIDRRAMGAHDGDLDGHAGFRPARRQFREPANRNAGRFQLLVPGLRRGRHLRRPHEYRLRAKHLSAHTAHSDDEYQQAAHSASAIAGSDTRWRGDRLLHRSDIDAWRNSCRSHIRRPDMRRCRFSTSTAARPSGR